MKTAKIVLSLLLIIIAIALVGYTLSSQGDLRDLVMRLDPQNLASADSRMLKARDRVLDGLAEGDRVRDLRNLDRYLEDYGPQLALDGENHRFDRWAALGGLVGIVLAFFACLGLSTLMSMPFLFNPSINLVALAFSAAIGVIFGYMPARRAARLDPIVALRFE